MEPGSQYQTKYVTINDKDRFNGDRTVIASKAAPVWAASLRMIEVNGLRMLIRYSSRNDLPIKISVIKGKNLNAN